MLPDVDDAVESVQQRHAAACPVEGLGKDVAAADVVLDDPVEHQTDDPLCHWGAWQSNWPVCKWADDLVEAAVVTEASVVVVAVAVDEDVVGVPAWATTAAGAHWNQRNRRSALSAAAAAFEACWPPSRIRRQQHDVDASCVQSWHLDACDDAAAAAAGVAAVAVLLLLLLLPEQRWRNTFAPAAWTLVPLRSGVCWDVAVASGRVNCAWS